MKNNIHTASFAEIKAGKIADVYFCRTKEILTKRNIHKKIVAEFVVKSFPAGYDWSIFAGLEELLPLLQGLPITVKSIPEGAVFHPHDPVLTIEGDYLDFGVYETAILGYLCQASGVATKAARLRLAAGEKTLLSFGARRMHPAIAPMIERSAYLGGCDGVAVVKSAELLGIPPSGTIPHALVLLMGDTVEAVKAFDEIIDANVSRIALVDTFLDEKFESIRVAEEVGAKLSGIRLDTPASRRGNFQEIIREIRWELELRGLNHVKIYISGGLDEDDVIELRPYVDGFGVGTSLSSAPVLDFSMDIVEINGEPVAKRGKMSGRKELYRCDNCLQSVVVPADKQPEKKCSCGGVFEPLPEPVLVNGKPLSDSPAVSEIRRSVLRQIKHLSL